jgi:hypothetical protein
MSTASTNNNMITDNAINADSTNRHVRPASAEQSLIPNGRLLDGRGAIGTNGVTAVPDANEMIEGVSNKRRLDATFVVDMTMLTFVLVITLTPHFSCILQGQENNSGRGIIRLLDDEKRDRHMPLPIQMILVSLSKLFTELGFGSVVAANVFIHAANCSLLFIFVNRLITLNFLPSSIPIDISDSRAALVGKLCSLFAAALYAHHPVSQSVVCVNDLEGTKYLCAIFSVLLGAIISTSLLTGKHLAVFAQVVFGCLTALFLSVSIPVCVVLLMLLIVCPSVNSLGTNAAATGMTNRRKRLYFGAVTAAMLLSSLYSSEVLNEAKVRSRTLLIAVPMVSAEDLGEANVYNDTNDSNDSNGRWKEREIQDLISVADVNGEGNVFVQEILISVNSSPNEFIDETDGHAQLAEVEDSTAVVNVLENVAREVELLADSLEPVEKVNLSLSTHSVASLNRVNIVAADTIAYHIVGKLLWSVKHYAASNLVRNVRTAYKAAAVTFIFGPAAEAAG